VGRKPTNRYWFKGRVLLGIGAVQGGYQISNTREYDWNPSDQTLAEKAAEQDAYVASQNGELYALLFQQGGIEQFDEEDRKLISAKATGGSTRNIARELNIDHSTVVRRLDRIFNQLLSLQKMAA
jgi:DNA-binding NarL/FixJ family response regulator